MSSKPRSGAESRGVKISIGEVILEGDLTQPEGAQGLILFAHGSGSSRHSRRNQHVAQLLNEAGFATLLFDLLTAQEEAAEARTAHLRFDIPLLADRLVGATDWARDEPNLAGLPIGYFGASTGGGAAIVAAAERPEVVGAVVSRGGRPDLAGEALPQAKAPTLLIVGSLDSPVITMNRDARDQMKAQTQLTIIPGASHLFEEPGKLDEVARLASAWFHEHLTGTSPNPS